MKLNHLRLFTCAGDGLDFCSDIAEGLGASPSPIVTDIEEAVGPTSEYVKLTIGSTPCLQKIDQ